MTKTAVRDSAWGDYSAQQALESNMGATKNGTVRFPPFSIVLHISGTKNGENEDFCLKKARPHATYNHSNQLLSKNGNLEKIRQTMQLWWRYKVYFASSLDLRFSLRIFNSLYITLKLRDLVFNKNTVLFENLLSADQYNVIAHWKLDGTDHDIT